MNIVVCCSGYPTKTDPVCPFVEQVVNAFSLMNISVTVVAPQSLVKHLIRGAELHPLYRTYQFGNGVPIRVYEPYALSFGNRYAKLNAWIRDYIVFRTLNKHKITADVYYGHFWHHAYSLYKYAKTKKKPLIVVTGESEISLHKIHEPNKIKDFIDYVSGVICVSTKNKEESIRKQLLYDVDKSIVIPNAIDNSLFKVLDKEFLRKSFGIAKKDFVIAFTGWYDNNKGVKRLSEAIKSLNNQNIKSIFIGDIRDNSNSYPDCDGILHKGRLPHDKIPEYLNMADVFVLPTLHEGCNNAIIEAMACGLPVISSNLPFNLDILNDSNSILIDPMNVEEIANAINTLYGDERLRLKLSEGALKTASELTISNRANKILNFIKSKIK